MSKRFTRAMTHELIAYVKSVEINLNVYHPNSVATYEFMRQMNSDKLKKINPKFDCIIKAHKNDDNPIMIAEYLDGSKLTLDIDRQKLDDLRSEFYSKAEAASENVDLDTGKQDDGGGKETKGKGKGGKK